LEKVNDIYWGNFNDRAAFIDSATELLELAISAESEQLKIELCAQLLQHTSLGRAQLKRHMMQIESKVALREIKLLDIPWYVVLVNKRKVERFNFISSNFPDYMQAAALVVQSFVLEVNTYKLLEEENLLNNRINELAGFLKQIRGGFISDNEMITNSKHQGLLLEIEGSTIPQLEDVRNDIQLEKTIPKVTKNISKKVKWPLISVSTQAKIEKVVKATFSGIGKSKVVLIFLGGILVIVLLLFLVYAILHPFKARNIINAIFKVI
jgi:hypothetical protein